MSLDIFNRLQEGTIVSVYWNDKKHYDARISKMPKSINSNIDVIFLEDDSDSRVKINPNGYGIVGIVSGGLDIIASSTSSSSSSSSATKGNSKSKKKRSSSSSSSKIRKKAKTIKSTKSTKPPTPLPTPPPETTTSIHGRIRKKVNYNVDGDDGDDEDDNKKVKGGDSDDSDAYMEEEEEESSSESEEEDGDSDSEYEEERQQKRAPPKRNQHQGAKSSKIKQKTTKVPKKNYGKGKGKSKYGKKDRTVTKIPQNWNKDTYPGKNGAYAYLQFEVGEGRDLVVVHIPEDSGEDKKIQKLLHKEHIRENKASIVGIYQPVNKKHFKPKRNADVGKTITIWELINQFQLHKEDVLEFRLGDSGNKKVSIPIIKIINETHWKRHVQEEFYDTRGNRFLGPERILLEQIQKLKPLIGNMLKESDWGKDAISLGTACSGTDAPWIALEMFQELYSMIMKEDEDKDENNMEMETKENDEKFRLDFQHLFSCEIEAFKQAYIYTNFAKPGFKLFKDITKLDQDKAPQVFGNDETVPKILMFVAGTSCKDFSNLKQTTNSGKHTFAGHELGVSIETFFAAVDTIYKTMPEITIFENVKGAPWIKMMEYISGRVPYKTLYKKLSSGFAGKSTKEEEDEDVDEDETDPDQETLKFNLEDAAAENKSSSDSVLVVVSVPKNAGVRLGAILVGKFAAEAVVCSKNDTKQYNNKNPKGVKVNKKMINQNGRSLLDILNHANVEKDDGISLIFQKQPTAQERKKGKNGQIIEMDMDEFPNDQPMSDFIMIPSSGDLIDQAWMIGSKPPGSTKTSSGETLTLGSVLISIRNNSKIVPFNIDAVASDTSRPKNKKKMDGLDYDFEMRNSSKNKDGHILEKYLSIGKHDVLVFYKDKTCNDGFDCALASVSSIDYGLPQIRQRKYLLAWPRNGIIGKCGNASLIGRNWLELMEFLKSKVPHSVKNYIDEMDDPSVLRWTEALSGQLGIMTKKMKAQSNPTWWATDDKDVSEHNITYNYDVGSKLHRVDGILRPATVPISGRGDHGTCCTNPGMSPDFSAMTEPRKCDVIDKFYVGHLCENPPRDVLHTGCLIKDLSQNVDRGSYTSQPGYTGCITPCGVFYPFTRGIPLTGDEKWKLNGLPTNRLRMGMLTEVNKGDMAGNAMTLTVIAAAQLAALCIPSFMRARKENQCYELINPNSNIDAGFFDFVSSTSVSTSSSSSSTLTSTEQEEKKDFITSIHALAALAADAEKSSMLCLSEKSGGFCSKQHIQRCDHCGITICEHCVNPRKASCYNVHGHHDLSVFCTQEERVHPDHFESRLFECAPGSLRLQTSSQEKETNLHGLPVGAVFDLDRVRRSVNNWKCIYTARANRGSREILAELIVTVGRIVTGATQPLGAMLLLRSFCGQRKRGRILPCARMVVECSDGQKQTTLPHWEHRLAKNVEREVFLSGKGASPSIRNKCGLLRYKDENVPEIITVREDSAQDKIDDIAGDYQLQRCTGSVAFDLLYRRIGEKDKVTNTKTKKSKSNTSSSSGGKNKNRFLYIKCDPDRIKPDEVIISASPFHKDETLDICVLGCHSGDWFSGLLEGAVFTAEVPWTNESAWDAAEEAELADAKGGTADARRKEVVMDATSSSSSSSSSNSSKQKRKRDDDVSEQIVDANFIQWQDVPSISFGVGASPVKVSIPSNCDIYMDDDDAASSGLAIKPLAIFTINSPNDVDLLDSFGATIKSGNYLSGSGIKEQDRKRTELQLFMNPLSKAIANEEVKQTIGNETEVLSQNTNIDWGKDKVINPEIPQEKFTEYPRGKNKVNSVKRQVDPLEADLFQKQCESKPLPFALVKTGKKKFQLQVHPRVLGHESAAKMRGGRELNANELKITFAVKENPRNESVAKMPSTFHVRANVDIQDQQREELQKELLQAGWNSKYPLYTKQTDTVAWMLAKEQGKHEYIEREISSAGIGSIKGTATVERAVNPRGGILNDEMGAGKTAMAIALIAHTATFTKHESSVEQGISCATVVVAPENLVGQWNNEFEKFTTDRLNILTVTCFDDLAEYTLKQLCECDVLIVSSSILADEDYLLNLNKKAGLGLNDPHRLTTFPHKLGAHSPDRGLLGIWLPYGMGQPYGGGIGKQNLADISALFHYRYHRAVGKIREKIRDGKQFKSTAKNIPLEYITFARVVNDEVHMALHPNAKDNKLKKNCVATLAARCLMGVHTKDMKHRPLRVTVSASTLSSSTSSSSSSTTSSKAKTTGSVWGLTATANMINAARVAELSSICGGNYVCGQAGHWRKREQASALAVFYELTQRPNAVGYDRDCWENAQEYLNVCCRRNGAMWLDADGKVVKVQISHEIQNDQNTRMTVDEGTQFIKHLPKRQDGSVETSYSPSSGQITTDDKWVALLDTLTHVTARKTATLAILNKIFQDDSTTSVLILAPGEVAVDAAVDALKDLKVDGVLRVTQDVNKFAQRENHMETIQDSVLILSTDNCAGHNFQHVGHNVIIFQPCWGNDLGSEAANQEEQGIGRMFRAQQKNDVVVHHVLVQGPKGQETLDHMVHRRNMEHRRNQEAAQLEWYGAET